MAKSTGKEEKQVLYNAIALVYLKYDKECYKIGDKFQVREDDAKELEEKGYANIEAIDYKEDKNFNGDEKEGE